MVGGGEKREGKRAKYLEKKIRSVNCPTNLSELGSLTLGIYSLPKTRTEMEKEEYILRKKNWHRLVERSTSKAYIRGPRVLKNMSTPRLLFLATGRDWETLIPLKLSRPRS